MEFSSRRIQFLDFSVLILSCVAFSFWTWTPYKPLSQMIICNPLSLMNLRHGFRKIQCLGCRIFQLQQKVSFSVPAKLHSFLLCFVPATIANQGCIFFNPTAVGCIILVATENCRTIEILTILSFSFVSILIWCRWLDVCARAGT